MSSIASAKRSLGGVKNQENPFAMERLKVRDFVLITGRGDIFQPFSVVVVEFNEMIVT